MKQIEVRYLGIGNRHKVFFDGTEIRDVVSLSVEYVAGKTPRVSICLAPDGGVETEAALEASGIEVHRQVIPLPSLLRRMWNGFMRWWWVR